MNPVTSRSVKGKEKEYPKEKAAAPAQPPAAKRGRGRPRSKSVATPAENTFRLSCKTLFLTYPRCPLEKEDVLVQLGEKLGDADEYLIAQEHHEEVSEMVCTYIQSRFDYYCVLTQQCDALFFH